jgi:hypothetical protein
MACLEAAKLFPNDAVSRHAYIVAKLVSLAAMVEPDDDDLDPAFRLCEAGMRERAELFAQVQKKLQELGGYAAISRAMAFNAQDSGKMQPQAKAPGPTFLYSRRMRSFVGGDGKVSEHWVIGNHNIRAQHLRLAGCVVETMISDGCSHEEALRKVAERAPVRFPAGKRVSQVRQMRQIWREFRTVAHIEAAIHLPPGRFALGEALTASEAVRRWVLDCRKRPLGRSGPLVEESELYRVPAAWLPYIPQGALVTQPGGLAVEFSHFPPGTSTGGNDSQVSAKEREAFLRAARSTRVWGISFPLTRPES